MINSSTLRCEPRRGRPEMFIEPSPRPRRLRTRYRPHAFVSVLLSSALGGTSCGSEFDNCTASRTCSPPFSNGGSAGSGAGTAGHGGAAGTIGAAGNAGRTHGGASGDGGESGMGANGAGEGGTSSGKGGTTGGKAGKSGTGGTETAGAGGEAWDPGGAGQGGSEPCDGDCKGETPICVPAANRCVQCTASNSSACDDDTPVCNTDTKECVACLTSDDCPLTTAARCDESNACVACTSGDDCAHLSGTNACDSGTCVECTPADESACGVNSCDPATHECTETPRGSVGPCEPCLADSECDGSDQVDPLQRCVPMQFYGYPRAGGFCLRRAAIGCSRPYSHALVVESLSGAPEEMYCTIIEETTRCEAVFDLISSRACIGSNDCGCARDEDGICLQPGKGGHCGRVGGNSNRCTYQCGTLDDCPSGFSCVWGTTGPSYCQ
jgi:hypothetical protein